MDKRIFVEKKADFRVKSDSLVKELQHNLQLKTLNDLRIVQVYDVFNLAEDLFARAEKHIFSEQVTDTVLDDPFINDEHVKFLDIANDEQIAYIKEETRHINELLKDWFAQIGLRLIDFKLEFGFDKDGKIILADEFSPDNCRLWDAEGHHMDKDVFRRDLGSLTDVYKVVLEKLQGLK